MSTCPTNLCHTLISWADGDAYYTYLWMPVASNSRSSWICSDLTLIITCSEGNRYWFSSIAHSFTTRGCGYGRGVGGVSLMGRPTSLIYQVELCVSLCPHCVSQGNVKAAPGLRAQKGISKAGSLEIWTEVQRKKRRRGSRNGGWWKRARSGKILRWGPMHSRNLVGCPSHTTTMETQERLRMVGMMPTLESEPTAFYILWESLNLSHPWPIT